MSDIAYRAGQEMTCTVKDEEPGGYSVALANDSRGAFLPTNKVLEADEQVGVVFICMHGNRVLLSMSHNEFQKERPIRENWDRPRVAQAE
jgi:hypothetical protein